MTAVRGANRVMAGGIAESGYRSVSHPRIPASPDRDEVRVSVMDTRPVRPKTVVAFPTKGRSPWTE